MRLVLLLALGACNGISGDVGTGETLAQSPQARAVAVGGTDLYYASDEGLFRTTKTGGTSKLLASSESLYSIAADARGVYWLDGDRVMAYRTTEGAAVEIGRNPNGPQYVLRNFIVENDAVYYADGTGSVWRTPTTGGGSTLVGTTDTSAGSVAVAPDGVWVSTLHGAKHLATGQLLEFTDTMPDCLDYQAGSLYVCYGGSGAADGAVARVSLGGEVTMLADDLMLPGDLTVTFGGIYIVTGNEDSAVRRIPLEGGGSEAIAAGNWPTSLVVDEQYAYWAESYEGLIRRTER